MKIQISSVVFVVVAVTISVFLGTTRNISASLVDDLQKSIDQKNSEIKQLEEQAKKYKAELDTKSNVSKTLKSEIAKIDATIKQLQGDIKITEKKLQKTELEIKETAVTIDEKEVSIQKLRQGLVGIVQSISESDQETPLKVMLKNNSLAEFMNQITYANLLQRNTLISVDNLRSLKNELQIQKTKSEEKKGELQNLEIFLEDSKKITTGVKQDKATLLAQTKSQEQRYQAMLRETEKKKEAILKEIDDIEENLRKLVNPDSLPKNAQGLLLKPVKGVITQGYGATPFTKGAGKDFYNFHNGIDIGAPIGTPVWAADDGIVMGTGNTDNYCPHLASGRYIVIKHADNLATMYGHLSLIKVDSGQSVKRGDIVGYVGVSGLTTGSHLHFTVYDARTVEIRKGSTGACGLLPFGGSVNPLNYL